MPIPASRADVHSFLADHFDTLLPVLDHDVTAHDELAQVRGIRITSVNTTDLGIDVHYIVSWHAFHACSDQTVCGESARVVRGRLEGPSWVFEPPAPPPGRDTVDEF
ncbi:MAG: hypothetical protein EOP39_04450 [Rubrivivax sp.]|nr:MAG: hypothetical protein EOP39_04450 [Rubrivivax sp.]